MNCGGSDIRFELMVVMYNIGALHTYLGAIDSRSNPDGMKMACTHFQCAAWAFQVSRTKKSIDGLHNVSFQTVKEKYHQFIIYISSVELIHFYQQVCLAQAQECILEKSMLDNRKATIIGEINNYLNKPIIRNPITFQLKWRCKYIIIIGSRGPSSKVRTMR